MKEKQIKHNLEIIIAEVYNDSPGRYELRKGNVPGAPLCPFGNNYEWIGYDTINMKYVRFSKSVFKRLIKGLDDNITENY